MKFIKAFFSMMQGMFVTALGPVWNHPLILKTIANFLFLIALLVTLFWVLFWLGQKPVFTLNHLTVESMTGQELKHIHLPVIKAKGLQSVQGNFFTIRLDHIRQTFETMPWVRKASVRREWPNGIVVAIEEHQAMGIWGGSDNPRLMNTYGEVFTANLAEVENASALLKLSGPEGSNLDVYRKINKVNEWFKPWDAHVLALDLSSRYAWRVKLSNGITIDLGRELDERDSKQIQLSVERLLQTWPQVEQKWGQRVDSVDLRYANGYAIQVGKKL